MGLTILIVSALSVLTYGIYSIIVKFHRYFKRLDDLCVDDLMPENGETPAAITLTLLMKFRLLMGNGLRCRLDIRRKPMTMIKNIVTRYLDKEGWHYEQMPDRDTITLGLNTDVASHRLAFDFKDELDVVILYVMHHQHVAEAKRSEIAEYLARANYGLILGNYELDFDDGEVRFKISIDVEGGELSETMLENMVSAAMSSVDRYYGGLMAIQYGDLSACEAIVRAEMELVSIADESGLDEAVSDVTPICVVH